MSCAQQSACGWCQDTQTCEDGAAAGPTVGTCSEWSFAQCSSDTLCATLSDCVSCLEADFAGQTCGFCVSSATCHAGNAQGPFVGSCNATKHSSYQWRFDDGDDDGALRCFQPQPFAVNEANFTIADEGVFAYLTVVWAALVVAVMAFVGLACWKGKLVPQPGEARSSDDHAALRGPENVKPHRLRVDPECGGLCCSDLSTPCARACLFALSLLMLALPLVSLGLDSWSQSTDETGNAPLLHPPFTVVQTIEGAQQVYVSLEDSKGHRDQHGITAYAYECDNGSKFAAAECKLHAIAGIHTLVAGGIAALCALVVVLMALTDLCCPGGLSLHRATRVTNGEHSLALSSGDSLSMRPKVRYPFSVLQWRMPMLCCVFSLAACAFWLAAFGVSRQHMAKLLPAASWLLMAVSACASLLVALLYRRAIRVTPREGYVFRHPLRAFDGAGLHTQDLLQPLHPGVETERGTEESGVEKGNFGGEDMNSPAPITRRSSQAQIIVQQSSSTTGSTRGSVASSPTTRSAAPGGKTSRSNSKAQQSSYHSFSAHGTMQRSQAVSVGGAGKRGGGGDPRNVIAHSYVFAPSTPQQHAQLAHGPALLHLAGGPPGLSTASSMSEWSGSLGGALAEGALMGAAPGSRNGSIIPLPSASSSVPSDMPTFSDAQSAGQQQRLRSESAAGWPHNPSSRQPAQQQQQQQLPHEHAALLQQLGFAVPAVPAQPQFSYAPPPGFALVPAPAEQDDGAVEEGSDAVGQLSRQQRAPSFAHRLNDDDY